MGGSVSVSVSVRGGSSTSTNANGNVEITVSVRVGGGSLPERPGRGRGRAGAGRWREPSDRHSSGQQPLGGGDNTNTNNNINRKNSIQSSHQLLWEPRATSHTRLRARETIHFKHAHWWGTRSRSKFASHYAWGTNGVCEWNARWMCTSTWIPTWHQMDHVSWSLGLFSKTTSWR
jgi:hypothetical protein